MALILLLIGFLDSTFALIGQNEPIYETTKQPAKNCFSTAAWRLQQRENYPLVLLAEERKAII